jgi:hypothetical protein
MTIKAIETVWKGYRFRSRLEARWAVFFDALGLRWEYEPEGFVTSAGWYLPDFYLPQMDLWVEVKPDMADRKLSEDDEDRMKFFVFQSRKELLVLDGTPAQKTYKLLEPDVTCAVDCKSDWDPFLDSACESCKETGRALPTARYARVCWFPKYLPNRLFYEPGSGEELETPAHAIYAARSARFEHGEVPA